MAESLKHRGSIDRLSDLPEFVLCHILSFLPTKYAIRTSILSTRWRNLPTLVSNLDFDGGDPSDAFMNFVDRALLFHDKTCIRRFRLVCDDSNKEAYAYRICGWITYALKQPLQELYVETWLQGPSCILPVSLFTSKTLVKLELRNLHCLDMNNIPTKVSFPNLKTLRLVHVDLRHKFVRLVSGCPVLEDLEVWSRWIGVVSLLISHSSLKTLTIGYPKNIILACVQVDAPNLVYLKLHYIISSVYYFLNLRSLVKADFNIGIMPTAVYNNESVLELIRSYLLGGIINVQSVRFTNDFLRALNFCQKPLPVYHNLVHLEISLGLYSITGGLAELLECTPKLRTLIFTKGAFGSLTWRPPERVPKCLSSHLKIIEIHSFQGQMPIVKYFLQNASVLEILKVEIGINLEERFEIAEQLLTMRRRSRICQVEIVQHCSSSSL